MLARVTQEVDEGQLAQPVQVVDHDRAADARREIQESLQLPAERADIGLEGRRIQQIALQGAPGRVADHARAAAHERDRAPAMALQSKQTEDRDEVPDMQ